MNEALHEDDVKEILNKWLTSEGWATEVAWGKRPGIDIDATRGSERWIIEVKGNTKAIGTDFNTSLGQILCHIENDTIKYAIAVPKNVNFITQIKKLSPFVRHLINLSIILVDSTGETELISPVDNIEVEKLLSEINR